MRDLNWKHRYPGGKGGSEFLIGVCSVQRAGPMNQDSFQSTSALQDRDQPLLVQLWSHWNSR